MRTPWAPPLLVGFALLACQGDVTDRPDPVDGAAPQTTEQDAAAAVPDSGTLDAQPPDAGVDAALPETEEPRVCSADGWCWELPRPQGHHLADVWASASDDAWAVGGSGLLLHYDGQSFSRTMVEIEEDLTAIHGRAPDDVWAVGQGNRVLHYDGLAWSVVDLEGAVESGAGDLADVWVTASGTVFMVGSAGGKGVLLRGDGETFTNLSVEAAIEHPLWTVWADSDEAVFVAGDAGTIRAFDGSDWRDPGSPTGANLRAMHGVAPQDIWVVGAAGAVAHFDGEEWRDLSGLPGGDLSAVVANHPFPLQRDAGAATSDGGGLTDAGMDAGPPPAPSGPWIAWAFNADGQAFRYNGTVWAEIATGTQRSYTGAYPQGSERLLCVGQHGLVQQWDGDGRAFLSAGSARNRLALFARADGVYSVGDETLLYDGEDWQSLDSQTDRSLYGLWGDQSALWAVGTAGTIVRFGPEGVSDHSPDAAGGAWLRSVWGAGQALFVVGHDGMILTRAAGTFLRVTSGTSHHLLDVWGSAENDFWAVGERGAVFHWDGMAWASIPTGTMGLLDSSLLAVWGSAKDDVWVVGQRGTLLHWDGGGFSDHSLEATFTLNDVLGLGPDEVYAVGTGGTVLHYDGKAWTPMQSGTHHSLESLAIGPDGRIYASGLAGTVLVLEP